VPSPYVSADHQIIALDGYYRAGAPDNAQLRGRITYDAAYDEDVMLRARIVQQEDARGDFDFREVELASIIQLSEPGDFWLDYGFYGGVHLREDELGFTARLLAAKRWGVNEFRSNVLLRGQTGDGAEDFSREFRFRISRKVIYHRLNRWFDYVDRLKRFGLRPIG